jgi:2-polyprenyl-3-methyl-5-hydroxy-6-metoxy-1,4-benzoquinol methylase
MKEYLYDKYVSSGQAGNSKSKSDKQPYFRFLNKHTFCNLKRDINILDIGCGNGDFLVYLRSKYFLNLYGVDVSQEQIDLASQNKLTNVVQGDLMDYAKNAPDAFFDVIIAKDILEHLTLQELFTLGKELKRVLRMGGTIIGHVPNANGVFGMKIRYGDLTHVQAFNEKSLNQLFKTIGFDEIKVVEDKPMSSGLFKSVARNILWELITFQFRFLHYIESGEKRIALSSNLTFFVS